MTRQSSLFTLAALSLMATAACAQVAERDPFAEPAFSRDLRRQVVGYRQSGCIRFPIYADSEEGRQYLLKIQRRETFTKAPDQLTQRQAAPGRLPAPALVVSGITASQNQRQAILKTTTGCVIVEVGHLVGLYRVTAIDSDSVTFSWQGQTFRLLLERQPDGTLSLSGLPGQT